MNKKGLSPLTSTIILLVISILIGVVVMTWGRSYVEQATAKAEVTQQQQSGVFTDLNDRLARGEITQAQYDQIKQVLLTKK